VAAVAREFWVGWGTIMAAVRDHGQPRIDEAAWLDHVGVVGVDETAFRAASTSHPTQFVTGIVDLTRRTGGVARLLDVVPGRSADALTAGSPPRRRAGGPGSARRHLMDTEDPARAFAEMGASQESFDVWFRAFVLDVYDLDLSRPPSGPMPRQMLDWSAPSPFDAAEPAHAAEFEGPGPPDRRRPGR
jgi:hypothetical protein